MRACMTALLVALMAWTVSADIPQVISYQGKVTDSGGSPIADGDYSMTFTIYDAVTGGTSLWNSGSVTVTVSGGVFSVLLGESPQPALALDFDADYWLEVDIAGDVQSPRVRLGSMGYAYMASGLVPGTEVSGAVTAGTKSALKVTNTATTDYTYGVLALSHSTLGRGVIGQAMATTGECMGVIGRSHSTGGTGVYGAAMATTGTNYGVYGETFSSTGYAGYFLGDAYVSGDLTVDGTLSGSGMGDITAVIAGTGLAGGATSGDATLHVAVPLALSSSNANPIISGTNSNTTGTSPGVQGTSASTDGVGVYGGTTAASGTTYGGRFQAASLSGIGVYGDATATTGYTYGVFGRSGSTSGVGVYGGATATTGTTRGVVGITSSSSGMGVSGSAPATTGETYGVYGSAASTSGTGVYGRATAGTGTTYGVFGETNSTDGYAGYFAGNARVTGDMTVDGALSAPGLGDITAVNAGTGLDGGGTTGDVTLSVEVPLSLTSTSAQTIQGLNTATTGTTYGVYGSAASTSGAGVYGGATAATGYTYGGWFKAASTGGRGVYGYANATTGYTYGGWFEADATNGSGVAGIASAYTGTTYGGRFESFSSSGTGVSGINPAGTGETYGVYGYVYSPSGYGVYYSGGLAGTGSKSCVVKTSQGPTLMYCQESPENWFEDFGEGQLVNGRCHIELDPLFRETVTIDAANPMKVFLQPQDMGCKGLAALPGVTGFDVGELLNGTSNSTFTYRVVAKRKGFETKRLDYCKAAETDSYLFPELREKELREHEEERAQVEDERSRMREEHERDEARRLELEHRQPEPVRVSGLTP